MRDHRRRVYLLVLLTVVLVVYGVEVVPQGLAAVGTGEALLVVGVGSSQDRLRLNEILTGVACL